MALDYSTRNRLYILSLHDYGEDDLLIEEMRGQEGVSRLFEFKLRIQSDRDDIDPRRIIGKPAILRIQNHEGDDGEEARHWNGCVSRFVQCGRHASPDGEDIWVYECDIVPWFWFMTQHEDCRIFQNKTAPQIVETIFAEFGYDDFKMELTGEHPALEYCTQYRETTFDFISRLLEREGIYYYFRHNDEGGETRHILVLTDNKDSNPELVPAELPFHHAGHAEAYDAVRRLAREEQMRTRKVTVHGWNYQRKAVHGEDTPTVLEIGADRELERYRYPGEIPDAQRAKQWSRVMMEAEEASHLRLRGESDIRILAPGHTFRLYDHPQDAFNADYMVVEVAHHGRNNLPGQEGASEYGNEFSLQPRADVFRPPQRLPWGLVRGPQTAMVVGPPGEELYTDALGRIKVRFHWDRKVPGRGTDMPDDKATCWVRVAQAWAGNGYGTMFIPRIGMEVVVDFLEGDPDQPIVTGCVYNGVNLPPLSLPAQSTRSTIKTLSSKGGGGFNELRFEDKKGSEEIFLHAQKNLQLRTGNCRTESVGVHSNVTIGKDSVEAVGENHDLAVGINQTVSVGSLRNTTIGADDFLTIGANRHLTISANESVTVGANHDMDVGANVTVSAGAVVQVKAGANLVLEAGAMLSLKAGGASIVLGPAGVQITGAMIFLNSGGAPLAAMKAVKADKAEKPKEALKAIASAAGKVVDSIQQLQAQALRNAAQTGQPFCAMCEAARAALGR